MRALPLGFRYCRQVNLLACLSRSLGSIVASAVRNGGPLMNFVGQSMSGLNSQSQGYPKIIRSHPRSIIRNFNIFAIPPWNIAIGSQYFIHPPQLSVPLTFLIPIGYSRSLGLMPNLWAIQISIQFLLAPLSTSAFSSTIPCRVTNSKDNQISLAMKFMYRVSGGSAHTKVGVVKPKQNPGD